MNMNPHLRITYLDGSVAIIAAARDTIGTPIPLPPGARAEWIDAPNLRATIMNMTTPQEAERAKEYAQHVVQTCQKEANDLKASNQHYIAENAKLRRLLTEAVEGMDEDTDQGGPQATDEMLKTLGLSLNYAERRRQCS
jgi:hypothetical protein